MDQGTSHEKRSGTGFDMVIPELSETLVYDYIYSICEYECENFHWAFKHKDGDAATKNRGRQSTDVWTRGRKPEDSSKCKLTSSRGMGTGLHHP